MGGEVHVEVGDRAGKFVPPSNENINAMKKDNFYANICQIGIKEKNSTI